LALPVFHEHFLLIPGFFLTENEEISAPPPCGLLIEIYLFYENWSTETFRKKARKPVANSHEQITLSFLWTHGI
jgi:hypothetical protein